MTSNPHYVFKVLSATFHLCLGAIFAVFDLFIFIAYMIGLIMLEIYGLIETFIKTHRPRQKHQ